MKKYYLSDAIAAIEKEIGETITQAEIAKAFNVTVMAINKRVNNKSELKVSEVHTLQKYFKCNILKHLGFNIPDAVEILPYNNPEYEHLIINSKVGESIFFDKGILSNLWELNEKKLCHVSMPGNNMNGGDNPIPNGTQLILDTTLTDILRCGIFAYITNSGFFVNKIKVRADGIVEFIHTNSAVENKEYSKAELEDMGFKVIGRMILSLSLHEG